MKISLKVPATMKVSADVFEMSWNSAQTMEKASSAPTSTIPSDSAPSSSVWK